MRGHSYRPASVTRFKGALDACGLPVSFTARVAFQRLRTGVGGRPRLVASCSNDLQRTLGSWSSN